MSDKRQRAQRCARPARNRSAGPRHARWRANNATLPHRNNCRLIISPLTLPAGLPAVNVNEDLHLDLDGFGWGDDGFFGNDYMHKRANYTYYKSVLRLAEQYAPHARSVIDVGAPWPYITAFSCEQRTPTLCPPANQSAPPGLFPRHPTPLPSDSQSCLGFNQPPPSSPPKLTAPPPAPRRCRDPPKDDAERPLRPGHHHSTRRRPRGSGFLRVGAQKEVRPGDLQPGESSLRWEPVRESVSSQLASSSSARQGPRSLHACAH